MANNKSSQNLYKLIRELTPHEKAYFQKYARQHASGNTEYLRLFSVMDKMKNYDDKTLKSQFKNISFLKNYLFNLLLKALVNYYDNPRHTNIYLSNLYAHAEVLEYKGFSALAVKELKRGIVLAKQKNAYAQQYTFQALLHRLQKSVIPLYDRKSYFEESYATLNTLLQNEIQHQRYRHEFDKLILWATQKSQGVDSNITEDDIDLSLLEKAPQAANLAEKRNYHEALLAYYLSNTTFEKAYPLALAYYNEEKKHLKAPGNDFHYYSQALTFCIITTAELHKAAEAEKFLDRLIRVKSSNQRINAYNLSRYVAYKIIMYSATKQFAKGAAFVMHAQEKYPQLFTPHPQSFHYHPLVSYSLYILFRHRDYDACINLLNRVDMVHVRRNAPYTYKDIEMLRLMLQAEMGNYNLLGNMVRSISLKLKKYDLADEYVRILLKFFKNLSAKTSITQKNTVANTLDKFLNSSKSKEDTFRYLFMGVLPYHEWIRQLKVASSPVIG